MHVKTVMHVVGPRLWTLLNCNHSSCLTVSLASHQHLVDGAPCVASNKDTVSTARYTPFPTPLFNMQSTD